MPSNFHLLNDTDFGRLPAVFRHVEGDRPPNEGPPQARQAQIESRPFYNAAGEDIPRGGCVWLDGRLTDYDQIPNGKKCDYPGVSEIGLATADVPDGGMGRVYTAGTQRPVTILLDAYADVEIGTYVCAAAATWGAVVDIIGMFLILHKLDSPLALARIKGRRY